MNKSIIILSVSLAAAMFGCRRTDVREMTVSIPDLNEGNRQKIVQALEKYNGIEKDSYRFDFNAKTLTLRYDSMQIAQANIRYAIDEKAAKVTFPVKTDDHAGY